MSATKPWDGVEQVNGGYIVVKSDGDVLCYHANDREEFREYLFRNTVFEYVSAKKYGWSFIEKSDGEYLLPCELLHQVQASNVFLLDADMHLVSIIL